MTFNLSGENWRHNILSKNSLGMSVETLESCELAVLSPELAFQVKETERWMLLEAIRWHDVGILGLMYVEYMLFIVYFL